MTFTSRAGLLRATVAACGGYILAGVVYILCLLGGLNFGLTVGVVMIAITAWTYFWLGGIKGTTARPEPQELFIIAAITAAACLLIKPHGAYDAWLHWNSLAKYMSRPEYFRLLHQPDSLWHADYPPGLPAPIGLVWRMLGTAPEWVPRAISFLFFLPIPLLLCGTAQLVGRRTWLWILVLALFTLNFESLSQGLNQYADIPLALLFLLSLLCWDMQKTSGDLRWTLACGLILGGCLLMKNEGAVLTAAFLASRGRRLLHWPLIIRLLPGLLVSVVTLFLYKRYIPTPNDVIPDLHRNPLTHLAEPSRYRIIAYYLARFGLGRFPLFVLFFGFVAWIRRRESWRLNADLCCLLLCIAGFLLVYLTTDIGLEWLVPTSLNRLMMQLLPAGVYIALKGLQRPLPNALEP